MHDPSQPLEVPAATPAEEQTSGNGTETGAEAPAETRPTRRLKPVKIIAIGAGVVLLLCIVACLGTQLYPMLSEMMSGSKLVGQPAPDFTLSGLDGQQVTLSELRGKPVALNFWATWCPSCVSELPDLQQASRAHQDEIRFYAINLDADLAEVEPFLAENGVELPVLLDTEGDASAKYRVRGIPITVFIDGEGNIAARHIGSLSADKFSDYVRQVTAGGK